ncbi:XRE family transcriptional regulator [Corallococcus sp. bb12-1]|uniref:XRE family transcriptional regulator n=1 Tax=Corallococcus terminator TaxID=2316733 RepID=A0A3A8HN80_9BACT|nr:MULTISPECIES: XRE family transcriptional regulator [Corallococcus]MCY1039784.1 XRE family transcriptional regulator [Corallococcus sp. bb12-1]RKG72739.1 XRE family transcriptional regulator [Corallococcus terminator]
MSDEDLPGRLARNLRTLRETRGATQVQLAKLAGVPRATWAHLESGAANPTLSVLHRVAGALQVSLEELLARPKASARHYRRDSLPVRQRGAAFLRKLLPDPLPGMEFDRLELPSQARITGVPHTPGTREYLACESGTLALVASGERFVLEAGDVVVFRGDQKHSYENPGTRTAVGYSVVLLTPSL